MPTLVLSSVGHFWLSLFALPVQSVISGSFSDSKISIVLVHLHVGIGVC